MYNVYHIGSKYELPDEPYSVAGLKRKLDNLKRNNLTHSEEYNKVLHNYESLINRGDPLFVNMGMWKGYMESALFSPTETFLLFMLLILVCPLFSHEQSAGLLPIILSTKNGKEKIARIKILVSISFILIIWILNKFINISVYASIYGIEGWNKPIYYFYRLGMSQFKITMLQLVIIRTLVQCIILCGISTLVMFISSITKRPYKSLIISLVFIFYPIIIRDIIGIRSVFTNFILKWSLYDMLSLVKIFSDYSYIYVLGKFINPLYFVIIIGVIFNLVIYKFTILKFSKKEIS